MSDAVRYTIEKADPAHAGEWRTFVDAQPQATFFHRFEWFTLMRDALGYEPYFLMARDAAGALAGVLPLAFVRSRFFGKSLVSLPFCAYGGPLAREPGAARALRQEAIRHRDLTGAAYVEHRLLGDAEPGDQVDTVYMTFRGPMVPGIEDIMAVPAKRRNKVRKGIKAGLAVDIDRDAARFHRLYNENARDHGTPALGLRFFEALLDTFKDDADVLTVRDASGKDLSTILTYYHRGEAMSYFAGESMAARTAAANDFKYWQLMAHASRRGCTHFDFGRSKQGAGSIEFKTLWGFPPTQLNYVFDLPGNVPLPQRNPNNPKYRLMLAAWRKLPLPVAATLGPMVIHGLG